MHPATAIVIVMNGCLMCGMPKKRPHRTYCSLKCRDEALTKKAREAFWNHVLRGPNCWEWQMARTPLGYGRFLQGYAHRTAWEMTYGPIPPGMEVCHSCDNPPCARPDHLFLGSHLSNMRDARQKGRHKAPGLKGSQVGNSKLTEDAVREMRVLATEGWSQRRLAARFGVSRRSVQFVQSGTRWKHVA